MARTPVAIIPPGGPGKAVAKMAVGKMALPGGKGVQVVARPQKRRRSLGWLQGCLCGAAAALSLSTALLAAILLTPGLIALVLDDRASKPVARTMMLFGMAASAAPIAELWRLGHSVTDAFAIVLHLQTVLIAWMSGAFGWLLTELAPLVVGMGMGLRMTDDRRKLVATRAELALEWGLAEPDADVSAEAAAGSPG